MGGDKAGCCYYIERSVQAEGEVFRRCRLKLDSNVCKTDALLGAEAIQGTGVDGKNLMEHALHYLNDICAS